MNNTNNGDQTLEKKTDVELLKDIISDLENMKDKDPERYEVYVKQLSDILFRN